MRPCYHGNRSKPESGGRGEKSRCPQEPAATLLPQKEGFPVGTWVGVGSRLRAHRKGRPAGVGRGGRRPSAQQGAPGECRWAWEAAGLNPCALQDPGFWDPATRVTSSLTPSTGVHLRWWPLGSPGAPRGSPRSTPGSCVAGSQLCLGSCPSCSFFRNLVKSGLCSPARNRPHSHRWAVFRVWKLQSSLRGSLFFFFHFFFFFFCSEFCHTLKWKGLEGTKLSKISR